MVGRQGQNLAPGDPHEADARGDESNRCCLTAPASAVAAIATSRSRNRVHQRPEDRERPGMALGARRPADPVGIARAVRPQAGGPKLRVTPSPLSMLGLFPPEALGGGEDVCGGLGPSEAFGPISAWFEGLKARPRRRDAASDAEPSAVLCFGSDR